jgi:1-acyl-sn-glycerol-3-phosphate acyltransferase
LRSVPRRTLLEWLRWLLDHTAQPPEPKPGPEYRAAIGPPENPRPTDPDLHPDPTRPTRLYRFAHATLRLLLPKLFRIRHEGLENLPKPPFIIASNHQAWFDTLFLVTAFPPVPMIYTMAKRETVFNRRWKAWLVRQFGVFPISPSQGHLDDQGVASVYQALHRGGIVLIFPEGRYSRGRRLRPLKVGVAHFALQAAVPICPVAISGIDSLRPAGEVTITIGPAIHPDPPRWWSSSRQALKTVDSVRRAILSAFERGQAARARRTSWRQRLRRRFRRTPGPAPVPT